MKQPPTTFRAVLSGASGLVGSALKAHLVEPRMLSRSASRAGDGPNYGWDPSREAAPVSALEGADVVFHLAGEPIAEGRWSESKRAQIRDSRILGTRNLVDGLKQCAQPPKVLVCASATGFYGDAGDRALDESAAPGNDFLSQVCQGWESEAARAEQYGVRVVSLRFGMVLSASGGAFPQLRNVFRLGLGGALGSGKQWTSWIHIEDLTRLLLYVAEALLSNSLERQTSVRGVLNAVSPTPVTNQEFTRTLGRVLHRPTPFAVPGFALRLALGGIAEVLLSSQRVVPRRALDAGFAFEYVELERALSDCLRAVRD